MINVTKGLIIDNPWIDFILDGDKTWEMRSTNASFRGWFGLIKKGTGAIWGVARMVDCLPSLTPEEMIANYDKHLIPDAMIRSGQVAKWNTPWVLADVKPLVTPISYKHRSGAVIWVDLTPDVTAAIASQFGGPQFEPVSAPTSPISEPVIVGSNAPKPSPPKQYGVDDNLIGQVTLTAGNITHSHIYLRSFFHRFPSDAIGGSNKSLRAAKTIYVHWGTAKPVETDLDGKKKFFRSRELVKRFFEDTGAESGDIVLVEQLAPYIYCLTLKKAEAFFPH